MTQNAQNKNWKWFTVSWRSIHDRQTGKVHVEITRNGLTHAEISQYTVLHQINKVNTPLFSSHGCYLSSTRTTLWHVRSRPFCCEHEERRIDCWSCYPNHSRKLCETQRVSNLWIHWKKARKWYVYVALCSEAMAQTKKLEVSLQPRVATLWPSWHSRLFSKPLFSNCGRVH